MSIKIVNNTISILPASENPLSAEVVFIKMEDSNIIFDVGESEEAFLLIEQVPSPKTIVISHFHRDHMFNLSRLTLTEKDEIIAGDFSCKKIDGTVKAKVCELNLNHKEYIITKNGTTAENNGVTAFYLPSTHAKGSVGLEIGDYVFTGDATYATGREGKVVFNTSLLHETITTLEKREATKIYLSHRGVFRNKEEVLSDLKRIYRLRKPNEAYIDVSGIGD